MANLIEADLPSDQKKLILRYAAHFPRCWRKMIRLDWMFMDKALMLSAVEERTLQVMQQTIGSAGLRNFVVRSDGVVCYSQSFAAQMRRQIAPI